MTVQAIQNAVFDFWRSVIDPRLKISQAFLTQVLTRFICLEEQVGIDRDALLDLLNLSAGVDEAVRIVLQVVRPLDLQLGAIERCVALYRLQCFLLVALPQILLQLAVPDGLRGAVRIVDH